MCQVKNLGTYEVASLSLISSFILLILIANLFLIPVADAQSHVSLCYFYGEDCSHCKDVEVVIEELEEKYPGLEVHKFEMSYNTTNSELFNAFIQAYNPQAVEIPVVFIGNKSLLGYGLTKGKLEKEIEFCMQNKCLDPLSIIKGKEENQSPLLFMLIGTALIEGINPCGFAVLIFLLASLLFLKSKRSVLGVGMAFIASVFVTHFFVGFGIMECYLFSGLTTPIRNIVILIAISAGVINIRDFWRDKATLAIPSSLKPKIVKLAGYASISGAILLGFFATTVGLSCTGCIYLTMLGLIAETPPKTVLYLSLYNLFYVLPLFVIVAIIYKGTSPEEVEEWRKDKRRYMKLIGGLVMLAMGIAMLFGFA
jgi:cytochrome c biogenesis protein CcdA